MISGLIVTQLMVTVAGQMIFFEISIPDDVTAVTGIETSVIAFQSGSGIDNNRLAGILNLQDYKATTQCYATEVTVSNSPLENSVAGFPALSNPSLTDLWCAPYSGGTYREPERLYFRDTTCLYGNYKDEIGSRLGGDISYKVNIYTWIQRNEPPVTIDATPDI